MLFILPLLVLVGALSAGVAVEVSSPSAPASASAAQMQHAPRQAPLAAPEAR